MTRGRRPAARAAAGRMLWSGAVACTISEPQPSSGGGCDRYSRPERRADLQLPRGLPSHPHTPARRLLGVVAPGALAVPSTKSVAPPSRAGVAWSACAMAAPHHGVVHRSSRRTSIRRSSPVNTRRRESIATRSRPSAVEYSRLSHTDPSSAPRSHHLATGAGTLPCPGTRAGSITGPGRVTGAQQGPVSHDEVDLDRLHTAGATAGQHRQRGVCHYRPSPRPSCASSAQRPLTTARDRLLEGGVGPGDLDHRPQHREVRHAVRGRAGPSPDATSPPPPSGGQRTLRRPRQPRAARHARPPRAQPPSTVRPLRRSSSARSSPEAPPSPASSPPRAAREQAPA